MRSVHPESQAGGSGQLTPRQVRFIDEYLVDGNGARAAVAAGYGPAGAKVTAHRLTHANQAVRAEIRTRQCQDSQRLRIERQDVIAGLLEGIAMAKEQGNPAGVIQGWATMAKLLGYFAPKQVQVEARVGDLGELVRMERMSDAELLAMMAGDG